MRNKIILRRILKNQRTIYYLYEKLPFPLEIIDKIVLENGICWCKNCKRFSNTRTNEGYEEVPQQFSKKGWVNVIGTRVYPDPDNVQSKRDKEIEFRNIRYCFDCEKENMFKHVLNEKRKRNNIISNNLDLKGKKIPHRYNTRYISDSPDYWEL